MTRSNERLVHIYTSIIRLLLILLVSSNIAWLLFYYFKSSHYKDLYEDCLYSKGCWTFEVKYFQKIPGDYKEWRCMSRETSTLYDHKPLADLMLQKYLDNDHIYEVTHPTKRVAIMTNMCESTVDTIDVVDVFPRNAN